MNIKNIPKYISFRPFWQLNIPFFLFSQSIIKNEENFDLSDNDFASDRIIPKNFKNFLNYKSPEMTLEEIQNFDMYYKKYASFFKSGEKSKNVCKITKKHNIEIILKRKIGQNLEKILFFLENRGAKLTEIEFIYIFNLLTEKKELMNSFLEINSELLTNSISLIDNIFISNVENLERVIRIYFHPSIEYENQDLIPKFINILIGNIKLYESHQEIISSNFISNVLSCFLFLTPIKELDSTFIEKMIKIAKFLMKNLDYLNANETILFLKTIIQNDIVKSDIQMEKFDKFFSDCKETLDSTQSVDILYYFTKVKFFKNDFVHNFYNFLFDSKKIILENLENKTLSKLIWSFSQYDVVNEKILEYWNVIERNVLSRMETAEMPFVKINLVAFDKSQKGSEIFWRFFDHNLLVRNNFTFEDSFLIIKNLTERNLFDRKIFLFLLNEYESKLRFNYISELDENKTLQLFKVYVLNFYNYLQTNNKKEKDLNIFPYLNRLFFTVLDHFFSENIKIPKLEDSNIIELFMISCLVEKILQINKINRKKDIPELFEKLKKKAVKKIHLLDFMTQAKLILFNEKFDLNLSIMDDSESKLNSKYEKKLNLIFNQTLLNLLYSQLIKIIHFFWKNDLKNKEVWLMIQIKWISMIDEMDFNDFLTTAIILDKLESSKILEENEETWKLAIEKLKEFTDYRNQNMKLFIKYTFKNKIMQKEIDKTVKEENINEFSDQQEFSYLYKKFKKSEESLVDLEEIIQNKRNDLNNVSCLSLFLNEY